MIPTEEMLSTPSQILRWVSQATALIAWPGTLRFLWDGCTEYFGCVTKLPHSVTQPTYKYVPDLPLQFDLIPFDLIKPKKPTENLSGSSLSYITTYNSELSPALTAEEIKSVVRNSYSTVASIPLAPSWLAEQDQERRV